MGNKLSHQANARIMNSRISRGDLEQYFNVPSNDEIKEISKAINSDDADDVAQVLIANLRATASELETFFDDTYDSQYIQVGKDLVENFLDEQIIKTRRAVENNDISELEEIKEDLDFTFPSGLRETKNQLVSEIDDAIGELKFPDALEDLAEDLAEDRGFEITEEMTVRVEAWKNGFKMLVIRTRNESGRLVWKSLRRLSEEEYEEVKDAKKIEIKFEAPKKIKQKTIPEFRRDMRGKPLNFREKKFIDSRLESDFEQIHIEYVEEFGDVRTKTNLKKLVGERR